MIVISGRKNVYRQLGYVADFCPICRSVQTFLVRRIGRASHVYFISVGKGELAGYDRICQSCLTPFPTETKKYKQILKNPLPLPELQASTFPDLETVWQERMAQEAHIVHAPLLFSAEKRSELILHQFMLLVPKMERCYSSAVIDKPAALAGIAGLVVMVAGWKLSPILFPNVRFFPEYGSFSPEFGFFFLGIALFAWQGRAAKGRLIRREVIPALATALRPLSPTEAELQAAFAQVRSAGHMLGKKLNLSELQAQLK
ncbi:hypothetical protein INH39_21440 [Massilia violaceinigra]|uniref:Uncharacterized protein n=1 Tax=Massilia violaceinigra TaxID=2045208 RepID=A0ABY4A5X1_9BURK|nr:hypothetical protein [Massilia violaceinigra]UOD28028.1 hypothetical protein INH39_21440 [Massilia violaceinigra]